MRVIAGKARSLPLKTVEGVDTRPTTDRIKETLFNMIQQDIPNCMFLDLFAGSGSIGIEALSRGAGTVVFVEKNAKAAACIRDNLKFTRLDLDGIVMSCDVSDGLKRLENKGYVFDFVFMDPPYGEGLEKRMLGDLSRSPLIDERTMVIVEAAKHTDFDYLGSLGFTAVRTKQYKTNKHVFILKEKSYDESRISGQL